MKKLYLFAVLLFILQCSKNNDDSQINSDDTTTNFSSSSNFNSDDERGNDEVLEEESEEYPDGTYTAEVDYYNPETGTSSTYTLDVEVENGELTVIHWPNGGWLDESHFTPEDITSGSCSFTSDEGNEYTVTLD